MNTLQRVRRAPNFLRPLAGGLAFALLALFCVAPAAWAQEQNEKQKMEQQPAPKAVQSDDNGIYEIFIEDAGDRTGQYTAATASGFPEVGAGENVLFGGSDENIGTSFNTIRSYTSETDYVFDSQGKSSSFDVINAGSYGTVTSISNGFRTTYTLPGGSETPDALTVEQDLEVLGSNIDNSRISLTTTVTNEGNAPVTIGIRYLWDFQISGDDGPTYQSISPNGSTLFTEADFTDPGFQSYKVQDEDGPTFSVFGTVNGPSSITPAPVPPDLVQNVSWPDADDTAFDYTTDPNNDISTGDSFPGGDQATLLFWGSTESNAVTLDPGESYTVSSSVLGNNPSGEEDTTPPVCDQISTERNNNDQGVVTVEFTDNEEGSSGLSDISTASESNIASVDVESFVPGAEGPIEGTVTQDDPTQTASHTFSVTDVAGNETTCTQQVDPISDANNDGVTTPVGGDIDDVCTAVADELGIEAPLEGLAKYEKDLGDFETNEGNAVAFNPTPPQASSGSWTSDVPVGLFLLKQAQNQLYYWNFGDSPVTQFDYISPVDDYSHFTFCSVAESDCDGATLGEPDIDRDNRTLSNTITDDDGITKFTFSRLDNFMVQSISPSDKFIGSDSDGDGDDKIDTYVLKDSATPPTSVDFTLEAGDGDTSTYYVNVENDCGTTTRLDPSYEVGPAASRPTLAGNAPNPFSEQTTVEFALPEQTRVTVAVYDMMGRKVATLVDGTKGAGTHTIPWSGQSDSGQDLASGVYLLRMQADGQSQTRRVTIVR